MWIFDSTALVGEGEAGYLTATGRAIEDGEFEVACADAFRTTAGARPFAPDELRRAAPLRLYVARATSYELQVAGRHPVHGRGVDARHAADPTA